VFWFLLLLGILLVVVGMWGGPRPSQVDAGEERQAEAGEPSDPWKVLTEPLPHEEELIKLPEHRPWYVPGRDRRFLQGFLMGLGAGLMVASLVVLRAPASPVDKPPQTAGEASETPITGGEAPGNEQGQIAEEPGMGDEGPEEEPVDQEPEPETVLFSVEEGELPDAIAARLREAGLIEDETAFLTRLMELGLDTSLRPGAFEIPREAPLDDVIAALTQ